MSRRRLAAVLAAAGTMVIAIVLVRDMAKTAAIEAEWARRADGMPQSWRGRR